MTCSWFIAHDTLELGRERGPLRLGVVPGIPPITGTKPPQPQRFFLLLLPNAAEIRMRAERRLGELIRAQKETMGLQSGARGIGKPKWVSQ